MEIRKLNALRGIASLIVVVAHYSGRTGFLHGAAGRGAGQLGVMLFFILSGFLMSYLYMNKDFNKEQVVRFAIARIARVIPLFLIVVLCSYALRVFAIEGVLYHIPDKVSLFSHIALLYGDSILWTIPVEIQFYAFFVFLWWLWANRKGQMYIFLAALFAVIVFFNFPVFEGDIFGVPFGIHIARSMPYFLIGLIFGQLYIRWCSSDRPSSGVFALSLLIILFLYPRVFFRLTGYYHGMWQDVGVLFSMSLVFFLIVFLVPDKNILFSNRVGDFLGKISYSLYLFHLPVLWQLKRFAKEQPVVFLVIYLAIAISGSYLSYLIIETPLRRKIRSVIPKYLSS